MKKLLLALTIFVTASSVAQTLKSDTKIDNKQYYLIDTVAQSTFTKDQLYSNALSYITNTSNANKIFIDSKDQPTGEIIFHGRISDITTKKVENKKGRLVDQTQFSVLIFKASIFLKDSKFKIVLSSLQYGMYGVANVSFPIQPEIKQADNIAATELAIKTIKNMTENINKKPNNDF